MVESDQCDSTFCFSNSSMYSGSAIHRNNDLLRNIVQNLGVREQNLPEPMTRVQQGVGCHSSRVPALAASNEWLYCHEGVGRREG